MMWRFRPGSSRQATGSSNDRCADANRVPIVTTFEPLLVEPLTMCATSAGRSLFVILAYLLRALALCIAYLPLTQASGQAPATTGSTIPQPADTVGKSWHYLSEGMQISVEVVAVGVRVPVGIAVLPDGRLLVGDRYTGHLLLVQPGSGVKKRIEGLTAVFADTLEAGLLDVVLHPEYRTNGWIYLAYSFDRPGGTTTVVDRARLSGEKLVDIERLFEATPVVSGSEHYGGRLVLHRGFLFISLGDRNTRDQAQYLGDHHGKVIRLRDDGKVPADNPFVGREDAMPEIWSIGHRNVQGMTVDAATGALWANEHGPLGGDEINIVARGANYGWPMVTQGREYWGALVGKGLTRREGMVQPLHFWTPRIGPSGLVLYSGDRFPAWRGSAFSGAMAATHLNRLVFEQGRVVKEERLFLDRNWRVRQVVQGQDGFLYLGVDGGSLLRVRPRR